MKIVVAGGTGFLGVALSGQLAARGHSVVVLSRNPERARPLFQREVALARWDARTLGEWASQIDGADAVVNLTGESMAAGRWTAAEKEKILSSRVDATRAIVDAIAAAKAKPPVLVNASAVGYYGPVDEGEVSEEMPAGKGFVAEVCVAWEQTALAASAHGVRVVLPRMGVVLGDGGGALERMMVPFRLFAGGVMGTGKQWFPWIHRQDVASALLFALTNPALSGPVNLVAPHAVRMSEFCSLLGSAMRRPSWTRVPAIFLRIGLGEMAEMLLTGQRVVPVALRRAGFPFQFPDLSSALADLVKERPPHRLPAF